MADFKTALIALSNSEVTYGQIEDNIGKILNRNPALAIEILEQLQDAYNAGIIGPERLAQFKSYVTQLSSRENPEITIAHEARAAVAPSGDIDLALDFDLSPVTESPKTPHSDKGSTDTSWPDGKSKKSRRGKGQKIEPGTIIRSRFQLDKILGVGGMGTVFRGRDLIKVEARDKNPYVALKILNEDFKDHPDAFIALQREASRQQKLAHPNITTVHDFDRTEDGTFYLTMELLEGEPLNKYIKKVVKPQKGLPFDQAFSMIEGLAKALIYAHEHDIVHSDFKPGNCFVTTDGTMKVLDFGIARAVKTPGQTDNSDKTVFDPGKLGALTPPYASVEMLEEQEPDTRDDIYALACVAYELLTGKHPFNKLRATTARDNELIPVPVKGLTKAQNKAIVRGLGFTRETRSQTVGEFLEELRGKPAKFGNPWITIPSVAVILAAVAVFPLVGLIQEREVSRLINEIKSGEPERVEATLNTLRNDQSNGDRTDRIIVATRNEILSYYDLKIAAKVNVSERQLDLAGAMTLIQEIEDFAVFSDSTQVAAWRQRVRTTKSNLLNQKTAAFEEAILADKLLDLDDQTNDVHDILRVTEPLSPKLHQSLVLRLPGAYAAAIQRAIINQEFERAVSLSQAALKVAPEDPYLKDLVDKIAGAQERTQIERQLDASLGRIRDAMAVGTQLADFQVIQDDVEQIAFYQPQAPVLAELSTTVETLAAAMLSPSHEASEQIRPPEDSNSYEVLFNALGLNEVARQYRELLTGTEKNLAEVFDQLRTAILDQNFDINSAQVAETLAALPNIDAQHPKYRASLEMLSQWVLKKARRARSLGDLDAAQADIDALVALINNRIPLRKIGDEQQILLALRNNNAVHYAQNSEEQSAQFDRQSAELADILVQAPINENELSLLLNAYDSLAATDPASSRLGQFEKNVIENAQTAYRAALVEEKPARALELLRMVLIHFPEDGETYKTYLDVSKVARDSSFSARDSETAAFKQELVDLIEQNTGDRTWSQKVEQVFLKLTRLMATEPQWLNEQRSIIAQSFLTQASTQLEANAVSRAANLLHRANPYLANNAEATKLRAALDAAQQNFLIEHRIRERDARLMGLRQDFENNIESLDTKNATRSFTRLRQAAPTDDTFVREQAPRQLAAAYIQSAEEALQRDDRYRAQEILDTAVSILPSESALQEARQRILNLSKDSSLSPQPNLLGEFDVASALTQIREIKRINSRVFFEQKSTWAATIAERVRQLSGDGDTDTSGLVTEAQEIFIDEPQIQSLIANVGHRIRQINPAKEIALMQESGQLSKARRLLDALSKSERNEVRYTNLIAQQQQRMEIAREHFAEFRRLLRINEREEGRAALEKALKIWNDNETFLNEYRQIEERASLAIPNELETTGVGASQHDAHCLHKLAGLGKRVDGTCYDMLSPTSRGPLLVVIPAKEGSSGKFAIGKFEVTVGDFNSFCRDSDICTPDTETPNNVAKNNIGKDEINAYLAWLSKKTQQAYRIPTPNEWQYAASANGLQPVKDANCKSLKI
ncbi:MAG: bifunctional serine/threonine-protein kinase/formylglycine-generating enzyme family protein [Pseudomonadota bacterium]